MAFASGVRYQNSSDANIRTVGISTASDCRIYQPLHDCVVHSKGLKLAQIVEYSVGDSR